MQARRASSRISEGGVTSVAQGPCDAVAIHARYCPKSVTGNAGAGTLWATVLGSSLAFIDGSVVMVALPAMARDLGGGSEGVQWIVNGYLLPLAALVLLGGALADRIGRRRVFLIGVIVFSLASLACMIAPGLELLIAGRVAQGVGAAMLVPASLAILGASFSGEARGRAIGTWAAAGAATGALGPVLGGWLVDMIGWRAIFAVILPFASAALWLALRHVRESRDDAAKGKPPDWSGAAFATTGLAGITSGLTMLSQGGTTNAWPALSVGIAAAILFLVIEARRGTAAMMPLSLFGTRTFTGVTLLTFLLYAALGGVMLLVPLLLIARGWAATAAGAAILPLPIAMGLGSRPMGRLAERLGTRWPLTVGPVIAGLGFALFALLPDGAIDYWRHVFPAMALIGIGMTVSVAPLTSTVMAAVDSDHAGAASGVNNATARVAGLVATALIGLALTGGGGVSTGAFHAAALMAGALGVAAGLSALLLIEPPHRKEAKSS